MILIFVLIIMVEGEQLPQSDQFVFASIYKCNAYARAISTGQLGHRHYPGWKQRNVEAYCVPRKVSAKTPRIF